MSQHTPDSSSDWQNTLHGFGYVDDPPPMAPPIEPRFVPIGARVGKSGQIFETDGGAGADPLVIKLFTWAAGVPDQVVQDFTHAATTVANLRHPHIVQVTDAGTLGDGTPFLVMERLAGMTLAEAARGKPVGIAQVWSILRGVASALSAAHGAGVAHGDVRAENVFMADVAGQGWPGPKLLDFGVARLLAGARSAKGRPGEPPPEVAVRSPLELGPRAGERADQLALAHLAAGLLGPRCSPALEGVLLRATHPDPRQRFETVLSLVEAMEKASVRGAVPGFAAAAGIERTRVRAPVPIPSSHPVVIVRPAPSPVAASPRRVLAAAAAIAPSSLTQQFFAAGDQLEVAHAGGEASVAGHGAADDSEAEADDDLAAAPAPRVPRSRAQMLSAALLAVGSVAVIGWTVVSLATKPAGAPAEPKASSAAPVPGAVTPASARTRLLPPAGGRAARTAAASARSSRNPARAAGPMQPPPFVAAATVAPAVPAAPAVSAPPQAQPTAPATAPRQAGPTEDDVTGPDEETEAEAALAPAPAPTTTGAAPAAPPSAEAAPAAPEPQDFPPAPAAPESPTTPDPGPAPAP